MACNGIGSKNTEISKEETKNDTIIVDTIKVDSAVNVDSINSIEDIDSTDSVDLESLLAWVPDSVVIENRQLVMLMDTLYQYVRSDAFCLNSLESNKKWMDNYRSQLCRYYDRHHSPVNKMSDYKKADSIICEADILWDKYPDNSTSGEVISKSIKNTRLEFIQYNKFSQIFEMCETREQKQMIKTEFKAWNELDGLLSTIYINFIYLDYWGATMAGPVRNTVLNKILESHILSYKKELDWFGLDDFSYEDNSVFVECAINLLLSCCNQALDEYIYEEYMEDKEYAKLAKETKARVKELPSRVNAWVDARQKWINKMHSGSWYTPARVQSTGETLVKLANIISTI